VDAANVEVRRYDGAALRGVTWSVDGDEFSLLISELPSEGEYLHVSLPAGLSLSEYSWSGAEEVLTLVAFTPWGADIGAVPLAGAGAAPLQLSGKLEPAIRSVSLAPTGVENVIDDLVVTDIGGGQVSLAWTQRNQGDYNFDGTVTATDLGPIALHFLETIDRTVFSAPLDTLFWVDGNADSLVSATDIGPIGLNFLSHIDNYRIMRNGIVVANIPLALGQPRTGLPPYFTISIDGAITDQWIVAPEDGEGSVGADSAGGLGSNLRASVVITGTELFNLEGDGSGEFGPGKASSRVILPIDTVNRAEAPGVGTYKLAGDGTTTVVGQLPRSQKLILDFAYAPTINLATGQPRSTSGKGASAAPDDAIVYTSVPFTLPPGSGDASVDASIELYPSPGGGYFVELSGMLTVSGDDPITPLVEATYTIPFNTRLDYSSGTVSRDTNDNGDYEDEAELQDSDKDCISDSRFEQELDDDEYHDGEYTEIELTGKILSFNLAEGVIRVLVLEHSDGFDFPQETLLHFNEYTEFEERVKTDGDDIERDLDPNTLMLEDLVEIDLYVLQKDGLEPSLWMEKLRRVIDNTQ
jgi:hypothetical protein